MQFLRSVTLVALVHLMFQNNDAFSSININGRQGRVFYNSKRIVYQRSKSLDEHVSTSANLNLFETNDMVTKYRIMVAKLNEQFATKINMLLSNGNNYMTEEDDDRNKKDTKTELLLKEIANLKSRVDVLERALAMTKTNSPFLSSVMNSYFQQKKMELDRDFFIFRVANTSVVQRIAFMLGFLIIGAALASLLSIDIWYIGAFIGALYGFLAGNTNSYNTLNNNLSTAGRIQKYAGKSIFWLLQFLRYQLERQNIVPLAEAEALRNPYSSWITRLFNRRNFNVSDERISLDESRKESILTNNMESLKTNWLKSQEQDWELKKSLGNIWNQCVDNASVVCNRINAQVGSMVKGITPRREKDQLVDSSRYPFGIESSSETESSNSNKLDIFDALLLLQRYVVVSFGVFLTMDIAQRVYSAIRASKNDKK